MEKNLFAVILAGGKGERFWPLSTSRRPKQLIPFIGRKSLLALAVERVQPLVGAERIIVVTGCELVDAVRRELPQLPVENVIGEPFGRDTAAACGLGALAVKVRDPQAVMCILTADHLIGTVARFRRTLAATARVAVERGAPVTIGLKPRSANTGYGYIQAGPLLRTFRGVEFRKALRFVEKPDQKTAEKYVLAGDFYWNSGMFIWTVPVIWEMLERYCPKLALGLSKLEQFWGKPEFGSRLSSLYRKLERISVDYAVMEKAENVVMAIGTIASDD
ncbi:MAG: mannose-1-phosphate guanylyltransferase, partial [Kiritimatiellia bacterium]